MEFNIDFILNQCNRDTDCWLWQGALTKDGYGKVTVMYKTWVVHRYVYEAIRHKQLSVVYDLHHICTNKNCVNPDHLKEMTKIAHARLTRAVTHCKAGHELTDENVHFTISGGYRKRCCKLCASRRGKAFTLKYSLHRK